MSAAVVVLVLGVAGLVLTALMLRGEPERSVRLATVLAAVGGFVVALLLALALDTGGLAAVATATLGAAVLALALISQWRLFRSLIARQ
jgi:hypothetical protein